MVSDVENVELVNSTRQTIPSDLLSHNIECTFTEHIRYNDMRGVISTSSGQDTYYPQKLKLLTSIAYLQVYVSS